MRMVKCGLLAPGSDHGSERERLLRSKQAALEGLAISAVDDHANPKHGARMAQINQALRRSGSPQMQNGAPGGPR